MEHPGGEEKKVRRVQPFGKMSLMILRICKKVKIEIQTDLEIKNKYLKYVYICGY